MSETTGELAKAALQQAISLYRAGQMPAAERAFRDILERFADCLEAMHGLALVLIDGGKRDEARTWLERAITVAPRHPGLHYTLGVMAQEDADPVRAERAFAQAAALKPDFQQAWNNLGLALRDIGRGEDAFRAFQEALRLNPDYVAALKNLGSLAFSSAAWTVAVDCWQRLIRLETQTAALHRMLASALIELRELEAARHLLEQLSPIDNGDEEAMRLLAHACTELNDAHAARQWFHRLADMAPGNLRDRLAAKLTLPRLYVSEAALLDERQRFAQGVENLLHEIAGQDFTAQARQEAAQWSNFYLGYQGEDDRALQAAYGKLLGQILQPLAAAPAAAPGKARGCGRIRVGFASCFFRDCTVGHYFRSWITDLDRTRFETHVFVLGGKEDALSAELRTHADHYRRVDASLPEAAQEIRSAGLDILIYPELGMNGRSLALAAQRLAPVQCVAWGHPVTTGLDSIDYFFSSALMEPADGAMHYTEHLISLPGLGTKYSKPVLGPSLSRADLGLPEKALLYFYPHALFKVHPENDRAVARVLACNPDGILVLCADSNRRLNEIYLDRLRTALQAHGVTGERIHLLPYLPRATYLQANRLCDVMLDVTRWSGGNTSLDALAADLPIVTLPGHLMRGRQSAGILGAMGLSYLIADNEDDFVATAVELGCSPERRQELRQTIRERTHLIFDDDAPLRALEDHLSALHRNAVPTLRDDDE